MNYLEELAIKYKTDKKLEDGGHGYTQYYSLFFEPIRFNQLNILELGVREGWSLKMWNEYFPNSLIWGLDNNEEGLCPDKFEEERIRFLLGSQDDQEILLNLVDKSGGFDIIIDDASHISPLTIKSFEILFPTLKSNGLYVIEDLHASDYGFYLPYGPSTKEYLANLTIPVEIFEEKIAFIQK